VPTAGRTQNHVWALSGTAPRPSFGRGLVRRSSSQLAFWFVAATEGCVGSRGDIIPREEHSRVREGYLRANGFPKKIAVRPERKQYHWVRRSLLCRREMSHCRSFPGPTATPSRCCICRSRDRQSRDPATAPNVGADVPGSFVPTEVSGWVPPDRWWSAAAMARIAQAKAGAGPPRFPGKVALVFAAASVPRVGCDTPMAVTIAPSADRSRRLSKAARGEERTGIHRPVRLLTRLTIQRAHHVSPCPHVGFLMPLTKV
jgi:hypothetical protein